MEHSATGSFLNLDESGDEPSRPQTSENPITQLANAVANGVDNGAPHGGDKPPGLTFDELVDRLIAQPMSKADLNFIETFLCLYRKFAAPGQLFAAILDRLHAAAEDKSQHFLLRTNKQLRIVGILTKWIMNYPGDFASTHTRERLVEFVEHISMEPAFSYPALEMKIALRTSVVYDDDTRWEKADPDYESASEAESSKHVTPATSLRNVPVHNASVSNAASRSSLVDDDTRRHSEAISELSTISVEPSLIESGRPSGIHTVQEYEIEAATLTPTCRTPLLKPRWQHILEITDDDWANEITKIDWVLFSSVRVRDLLRDVSLSQSKKGKFKSLVNVTRAINHFNHLASWVTNLVLYRDKAKHRAMMLEKFMRIARKLREKNNYNGFAAVMAGLQSTAISRLAETQRLISVEDRKNFMKSEILMSPRKSHFSYRLAWQNSTLPRIPYIPLSRRDLASAEEGSKTMLDDKVNWKKMDVFGAVILPVVASNGSAYNIQTNMHVRQLILDTEVITDDEQLYQRSLQVEASSNPSDRGLMARFRQWQH